MYNNPYQMQPYPSSMYQRPVQPVSENTLIRVTGIEGARAYQMAPNSTVALFDGGEDLMYIKSTDGAGFPTIRKFRFTEVDRYAQGCIFFKEHYYLYIHLNIFYLLDI